MSQTHPDNQADLAFGVAKNPIARVSILARFSGAFSGSIPAWP